MKKIAALFLLIPIVCLADDKVASPDDEGSSKPKSHSVWMKQKLQNSQEIFAAMTLGDLETVKREARQMKLINQLESFVRGRSDPYRTHLRLFQFATEEIIRGAEDENIERVTLGYTQLSVSCVMCHKHLRESD